MTDFWQLFGRLAADDTFRGAIYAEIAVQNYPNTPGGCGISISQGDFDNLRATIAKMLPTTPVSLMSLGELLMCISTDLFRDGFAELICALKKTGVNLNGRSPLFHAALGVLMVDSGILLAFAGPDSNFDLVQFGGLTTAERNDLRTIANDPTVTCLASDVCYDYWNGGCNDQYSFYAGRIHPIASSYPPQPIPGGHRPGKPKQGKLRGAI